MDKAYIVHYVGYDYTYDDKPIAQGLTYDLPEEIHATYESAAKEFEDLIADELLRWDLDNTKIMRGEDLIHISSVHTETWTEILIKCVTIKQ